jgi:hypothetical protein
VSPDERVAVDGWMWSLDMDEWMDSARVACRWASVARVNGLPRLEP